MNCFFAEVKKLVIFRYKTEHESIDPISELNTNKLLLLKKKRGDSLPYLYQAQKIARVLDVKIENLLDKMGKLDNLPTTNTPYEDTKDYIALPYYHKVAAEQPLYSWVWCDRSSRKKSIKSNDTIIVEKYKGVVE